jgi:hypothetical protein
MSSTACLSDNLASSLSGAQALSPLKRTERFLIVDSGKSVIVIAHHQAVMAHADRLIDLGPGPDLVAARSPLTGERLAAYVGLPAPSNSPKPGAHVSMRSLSPSPTPLS